MPFLSQFVLRMARLAQLIESPRLLGVKLRGGSFSTVVALDWPWLHELNLATVLDIGANIGQFALTMRAVLPQARIISFEPLPDCFETLTRRMKDDTNFTAFNVALGDARGELPFQRNEFSPASSFLPMSAAHTSAFKFAQRTETVKVKLERLDDIAANLQLTPPYLAKLDVQGYEDRVLRGGRETLKAASVLLIEMTHERLYDSQALFGEIYADVLSMGFVYKGALDQMHDPRSGKLLQENGIFVKMPSPT